MGLNTNLKGQWDVNTRGRTDNSFREWVNGVTEILSGGTSLDTSGAYDGINFNGTTGYCRAALPAGLSTTFADVDYTIAVRCKLDTTNPTWQAIFGAFASASNAIRVGLLTEDANGDGLGGHVSAGASVYLDGATQIDDGAEHVLVQRRVGNVFSLWVDGIKINEQTVAAGTIGALNRISFGINDDATPEWPFDGTDKWAAIWDDDKSDADIGLLDNSENPFVLGMSPAIPYPGQLVTFTHTFAAAPLSATYRGVALTLEAGATATTSQAYWPARSAFRYAAAHAATRLLSDYALVIANASESVSLANVQTQAEQAGGFGTKNASAAVNSLGTWNSGAIVLAENDDVWMHVTAGSAALNPPFVDYTPFADPTNIDAQFYDVSAGSWSGLTQLLYTEAMTLAAADTTLTPGQTTRLTLAGGPFAGPTTASKIVHGMESLALARSVIDADETDVTVPALDQFSVYGTAVAIPWQTNMVARLEAGSEYAETPVTLQIVPPIAENYAVAGIAENWVYPALDAQQGDKVYGHLLSGAGVFDSANFNFTESEPSIIRFYTFNVATQRWLATEDIYIGYAGRASDIYIRAIRIRSYRRLANSYRPSRLRPFKF